ncbi:MAG TPA: hypothetical protein VL523_03110 [Terriglobia bacterium]|nr:hypothetical protein [Terriglobia bacterium]
MTPPGAADDRTKNSRARLYRALLAEDREIERLEEAVRGLRARHLELQEAFEQEYALPGQLAAARNEHAPRGSRDDGSHRDDAYSAEGVHARSAEEKVLDDARRFARLLVSEIALYHPEQLEQGRRQHDLYARLKASIERSRQAYDQRFGQSAAGAFNFFHDELVRVLAEDDPVLLGAGYPGPSA